MTISEPDPSKLLGVRRRGGGTSLYRRVIKYDPCAYCGAPPRIGLYGGHEIDHIRSRRHGGPDHWTNYTACNGSKDDMVLGLCDLRRGVVPEVVL